MRTQTVTGEGILVPFDHAVAAKPLRRCRAELSYSLLDEEGTLIARLIDFALDTIGAQTLDMRVTTAIHCQVTITVQDAS
jgi:hypothetical protein